MWGVLRQSNYKWTDESGNKMEVICNTETLHHQRCITVVLYNNIIIIRENVRQISANDSGPSH